MKYLFRTFYIAFYAFCLWVLSAPKCFADISITPTVNVASTPEVDNWETRHEKANREEKKAAPAGETSPNQGNQKALPQAGRKESFFIKAGGGTFLGQLFFTYYNRPAVNGIPSNINTTNGLGEVISSVSGGLDFPDGFSLFMSVERLPDGGSYLVNAQYIYPKNNPVEVYLYGGGGLGLYGSSLGPGFQLGLGTNIALAPNFGIFVETKCIGAFGYWTSPVASIFSYSWTNLYFPVLTGMKFTL